MTKYDKDRDLARILIEGTKVLYGTGKSAQLQTELERQKKLPVYRGNAEELTAIVDRVFDEPEVLQAEVVEAKPAESIDDVVGKPNMLRVATKGTWNLVKKMHIQDCYYPIVGFLPGRYQQKIAERYGDNPFHYTVSNAVTEGIIVSGLLSSLVNFNAGVGLGVMYCAFNTVIRAIAASESKTEKAAGSILIGVPFYVTLYSILAVKAIKNGITDAYSSALQEEKQKSRDKKIIKTVPVRPTLPDSYEPSQINIRVSISSDFAGIEESKPEVVDEEFEEEESEEARRKRLLNMDI